MADAPEVGDVAPNPDLPPDDPKLADPMPPREAPRAPVEAVNPAAKLAWRLGEARDKMLREGGGNDASQAAVDKGLDWLIAQQRRDGAWICDGTEKNPAYGTALGLLPLLGAGHGAKGANTKHEAALIKGLDLLLRLQRPTGQMGMTLYHHGFATLALCEAAALTGDARVSQAAQKAIDFTARSQHEGGGWNNQPRQPGDTSVTVWHVQSLKAAQFAGLKVPPAAPAGANRFLDSVSSEKGSAYGAMSRVPSSTTSAAGLYSRLLTGWSPRQAEVVSGVALLKLDSLVPRPGSWDSTFCYFATHLVFQVGGQPWEDWNAKER